MRMIDLAKLIEEMRTALGTTRIPEDQIPLIVGAAAGVIAVLTRE